jgi:NAD(P)-dependent dehydrogenase (short-subunit alcohol dehydrogenase family)
MATNELTALITGGTSGIGRATANKLAQLGIHVLVVGRNPKRGEETVAEIRAGGGNADFISSELRDASSAREVARRAVQVGGGHVDILINNAGIFPFGPTDQVTEEMFDNVYSLNVKVPYFLVAELATADGEDRQRSHRQYFDDGRRLRCAGYESVWLEQGRHQFVDQNVGG